jgi:PPOX class probable F420-dependent enzyme
MKNIPDRFLDLLEDDKRAFGILSTTMSDGSPQATPVWFNTDGRHILINSAKGRVKDRNMRERPHVAFVILDPSDPYRYMQIRGKVVEITENGARDHINTLSEIYTGNKIFSSPEGEIRVMYKIRIKNTSTMG